MAQVIVTGANRGLGLEFVRQLLARGDRVVAACRKPGQARALTELAGAYPGHVHVLSFDAASERSIVEFAREFDFVADRVDLLVANAGMLVAGERFGAIEVKSLAATFATNAAAPLLLAQALAGPLQRARGCIINVSSRMGSIAQTDTFRSPSYAMSKAALNMATRLLAAELAPGGVCVASVSPGWVRTDMGGAKAPLTAAQAVADVLALTTRLTPADSGGFFEHDGTILPW